MDSNTVRGSASEVSTGEVRPHACLEGVIYIGHLVEEEGDEVEIVEAVRCRRCNSVAEYLLR